MYCCNPRASRPCSIVVADPVALPVPEKDIEAFLSPISVVVVVGMSLILRKGTRGSYHVWWMKQSKSELGILSVGNEQESGPLYIYVVKRVSIKEVRRRVRRLRSGKSNGGCERV